MIQMSTKQLFNMKTTGKWEEGLRTAISVREFDDFIVDEPERLGGTNKGPNPLEYVLGGLTSCTSVMIGMISKEMDFSYEGVDFENNGAIDIRGLQGVEGVSTHFQTVDLQVVLHTNESDARVEALKEEVEKRCPVFNLLKDAGVQITADWKRA